MKDLLLGNPAELSVAVETVKIMVKEAHFCCQWVTWHCQPYCCWYKLMELEIVVGLDAANLNIMKIEHLWKLNHHKAKIITGNKLLKVQMWNHRSGNVITQKWLVPTEKYWMWDKTPHNNVYFKHCNSVTQEDEEIY